MKLHVNPIFYKRGNLNLILAKNEEVILTHGDKFSLLPDEFEYEIRVARDVINIGRETGTDIVAEPSSTDFRVRNIVEINRNLESGNMATSLSQIYANNVSNESDMDNDDMDPDRTPSPDALAAVINAMPSSSSNVTSTVNSSQNTRKRAHDDDDDPCESSSKRKSPCQELDAQVNSAELPSRNLPEPSVIAEENATAIPLIKIKPDPQNQNDNQVNSSSTAQSTSNPPDHIKQTIQIKPDPDSTSSTLQAGNNADACKSSSGTAVIIKTENAPTSQTQNANPNQNVPAAIALRPSCEHGIRCYRNTPEHRRDTAHPTDADYRRPNYPPAPSDAPHCQFGSSCYRRNPDHFRTLQHPSSSKKSLRSYNHNILNCIQFRSLFNLACCSDSR